MRARCSSPRAGSAPRLRAGRALATLAFSVLALQSAAVNAQTSTQASQGRAVQLQRTSFLSSDGVRLSVLEAGEARPGAPVLAFVPGWAMPGALWRAQLEGLAGRYRVSALDPRGQGESEAPAHGYTLERRADDLRDFLARFDAGSRVLLVGWSLGALESLHYVQRYGEGRLAGLVLVDSSVGEDPPPASGGGFIDSLKRDRSAALDGFVRAIFAASRPEAELAALRDAALRMPLEGSLSVFPSAVPRERWRETVRAFARPLLYAVTPQFAAQGENLRRHRPDTRVEVFAQAGHALFADEPERFNALLAEFAGSLTTTQGTEGKP